MSIEIENEEQIKASAQHTLNTFDLISARAIQELNKKDPNPSDVFANQQAFTGGNAGSRLLEIQQDRHRALQALANEPSVCRIVVLTEDDQQKVYYICRTTTITIPGYDAALASYRSPIGRIASFPVGEDITLPIGGINQTFEIIEKINLRPEKIDSVWDSLNSTFNHVDLGIFNVDSLRNLVEDKRIEEVQGLLNSLLADDGNSSITVGLRREVLSKMGLRDQPILDKFQDEIFREHLCSQLIITGPPGTGKTTTLIKRLGQKLDYLDEDERQIIESIAQETGLSHKNSWLMFTPTELLKQYVKEAFAKENIPAPDQRLKTWDEYRRHLARNVFGILKTSSPGGIFILKDSLSILNKKIINDPGPWFEEFHLFLINTLYDRLLKGLQTLREVEHELTTGIVKSISMHLNAQKKQPLLSVYAKLLDLEKKNTAVIKLISAETDKIIEKSALDNLLSHKGFFTDFAIFIDSISSDDSYDDEEDDVIFDDDDTVEKDGITSPKEAIQKYGKFLKTYSRSRAQNRSISEKSRPGKILQWLEHKVPSEEDIALIGRNVLIQNGLRRFVNPARGYVRDVAKIFRNFRKMKIQEGESYFNKPEKPNHISTLELDFILLAILKNVRELMNQSFVKTNLVDSRFDFVQSTAREFKNQILVDEATDFSTIQLAIMFNLTHPKTRSFFACGDYNQRITTWGCQNEDQLAWIAKSMISRSINISYRQSKRLNDFSNRLLETVLKRAEVIDLPLGAKCEGVSPVLLTKSGDLTTLCLWLRDRIVEIEQTLDKLPSIAVLVNSESSVSPLAYALNDALSDENIQAVACPVGQAMGSDNDVRVFDIQHIKGLEFEAVFFIDIDELADNNPGLFDKYLYVGATRAATYLGLTCRGDLPEKLAPLANQFTASFTKFS